MVIGCPIASSAVKRKMRSALAFQLVISPFKSSEMIASSDDSTIAASRDRRSKAELALTVSRTSVW